MSTISKSIVERRMSIERGRLPRLSVECERLLDLFKALPPDKITDAALDAQMQLLHCADGCTEARFCLARFDALRRSGKPVAEFELSGLLGCAGGKLVEAAEMLPEIRAVFEAEDSAAAAA